MKPLLVTFFSGLLFAVGLGVGGMTQPGKVLGFLDVFGRWDPSLAFVMSGAIAMHLPVALWLRRRGASAVAGACGPSAQPADGRARLVAGAAIFGVGWGLSGYCPGPAVVSLAGGAPGPVVFVVAMLAGMLLYARGARRA